MQAKRRTNLVDQADCISSSLPAPGASTPQPTRPASVAPATLEGRPSFKLGTNRTHRPDREYTDATPMLETEATLIKLGQGLCLIREGLSSRGPMAVVHIESTESSPTWEGTE